VTRAEQFGRFGRGEHVKRDGASAGRYSEHVGFHPPGTGSLVRLNPPEPNRAAPALPPGGGRIYLRVP